MARAFASFSVFLLVTFLTCMATLWGLQSLGMNLGRIAALSTAEAKVRPGYVSSLRSTKSEELNVATAVRVVPVPHAATAKQAVTDGGFTHTVVVESLRVRSGPNKIADQLFALKGGSKVTVIKSERGWVMIDAGDGRTGWVYPKFLRPKADGKQLQAEL